ncbi:SDR family oxidoreductase [Yinghuangia soli]|uniref:SDR family oxidoreductase n=1 Tax=Yinghuangia soli TaxID=2908204 RepID=A0AA41QBW0_9ACTN|nr:SDR family oxidoreductase [Yinghuangia soli]MCF2533937.1 SDR family oxidoreductase [Yinghuangia soli]
MNPTGSGTGPGTPKPAAAKGPAEGGPAKRPDASGPAEQPDTSGPPEQSDVLGPAHLSDASDVSGGVGPLCLVTGATGYIGGRLVRELLAAGYRVRCLARDPGRLRDLPWRDRVEVVRGDVTRSETLPAALEGVDVAYYLVHALGTGSDFEKTDRAAAEAFGAASRTAGVGRIIYLGGLAPAGIPAAELSPHLRSRAEVGDILLACGVPAVHLRAAVIIGSGSASFEMLRHLTERLPVMVTPTWVGTRVQPIAVRDVLRYLVGAAALPPSVNRAFDIGGPEVLTYRRMMERYATVARLPRRLVLPVPVLTPSLSSLWVGLVTPVPAGIARPLVESLRHEVVCQEKDIAAYVPDPPGGLTPFDDAVRLALLRIRDADVSTHWSSAALPGAPSDPLPSDPDWSGGTVYQDRRSRAVAAPPAALWQVIEGVGGRNGWYSFKLGWVVRGALDRLSGGVGLRRGRRDPHRLRIGDALDFWRVEDIEPGRTLRLRAEMRLPGVAWLELHSDGAPDGSSVYRQRAIFHPRGLLGHLYWWSVAPFHAMVFGSMARNIAERAERAENAERAEQPAPARASTAPSGAPSPPPSDPSPPA